MLFDLKATKAKLFTVALILLCGTVNSALARPDAKSFYQATLAEISQAPGTLIGYQRISLPAFYRATAWRILYATRDYLDRPIASSGMAVLPDNANSDPAARTIVAWAHPTVGIARYCAPTMRKNPKGAILGLDALVASGHIVVATDYPGLGTQGPIGYLVGKGQAQAVIDSVRAAKQIPGVVGGNRFAMWGYSQGGHAVLFAALHGRSYAPELRLVGVAAVAPPTDLRLLMLAGINTIEGRIFTSYTLGSWALKYDLPLTALADAAAIKNIQSVGTNCSDDFSSQLDLLSSQKPLKNKFLNQNPLKIPGWSEAIADNSITSLNAATPALIIQGGLDVVVLPQVTQQFVRSSCRAGATVKYIELGTYGHGGSAEASVNQAVNWINDRFRGLAAPSSCH